jgi:hypothetical protein
MLTDKMLHIPDQAIAAGGHFEIMLATKSLDTGRIPKIASIVFTNLE